MNWFTIYVSEPQPDLAAECQKNSAGQFILFDGRTTSQDIRSRAKAASLRSCEVQVFTGKRLGKLAMTFRHGMVECSYCGKAHLTA